MATWNPFSKKQHMTAAAGATVRGSSPASPDALLKRSERWQERVLELISAVPEPSGASSLVRNTMDRVVFRVEGDGLKKADVKEINRLLSGFDSGRAAMLIWQVGECFPAWKVDGADVEWEVYSPIELKVKNKTEVSLLNQYDKWDPIPPGMRWYRMWQPDPSKRFNSWSVHKSLIDLMESMYLHQLADTAVATSRLAGAGILFWPTDMPSLPLRDGRPEEGSREELQMHLQHSMMQSISERNSSDAVVPLIVFGDPTTGESFKPEHILLERPDDAQAFAARMEAYSLRYATAVELPIESVKGVGSANHWTAYIVKEDKWKFYIAPLAEIIADSLQKNFVKSMLKALGYSDEVIRKSAVVADGSDVIEKPDMSDKALKLADIGGYINREAVLRATGFDPVKDLSDGSEPSGKGRNGIRNVPQDSSQTQMNTGPQ